MPFNPPPPYRRPAAIISEAVRPPVPARRLPSSTSLPPPDQSQSVKLSPEDHIEYPYIAFSLERRPATFAASLGGLKDSWYRATSSQLRSQLDRLQSGGQPREHKVGEPGIIPFGHQIPPASAQRSIHTGNSFNLAARAPEEITREILKKALLARTSSANQREVRAGANTKPNNSPTGAPVIRRTISTESTSSHCQPTPLTTSCSSPSCSPERYVAESPFRTLLEISGEMPTAEFLDRLTNLHVDETPEERRASLNRYGEWMALSPETRMEIAGTSVDPKYCYGAMRVVGEWKWEQSIDAEIKALLEGKGKGARLEDSDHEESDGDEWVSVDEAGAEEAEERGCARDNDVASWTSTESDIEAGSEAAVSNSAAASQHRDDRWAERQSFSKAWVH